MTTLSELELVGRLILATSLGFLIGLERELAGQPAGERTHALASLGAATFALISIEAFPGSDPARVAAGVVTGLGFLGAGMILKGSGDEVHGLTTAAGIWAVGGIGLAVGAGLYLLGVSSAILVGLLLTLERLLKIDQRLERRKKEEEYTGMHTYFEVQPTLPFDPTAIVTSCIESGADALLIDKDSLPADFFDLSSGLAGELLHRLSIYQMRLAAVVPDLTVHSSNFQAFAFEANKGEQFRFFPTRQEAIHWLESEGRSHSGQR